MTKSTEYKHGDCANSKKFNSAIDLDNDQESWSPDSGEDLELVTYDQDIWPADSGDDIDQDNLTTSTMGQ